MGSTGRSFSAGKSRSRVVRLATVVQAVPDRERDPEKALPADQPVAREASHPVLVAGAHECRVPLQLSAQFQQGVPVGHGPDPPLTARYYLERSVALFVELDGVHYGARFASCLAGLPEQLDNAPLRGGYRFPRQFCRIRGCALLGQAGRSGSQEPAVAPHHRSHGQAQLAPPHDIGHIAEGAHHRRARTLVRLCQWVGHHRDRGTEKGCPHRGADQRGVAFVGRVHDDCDARWQELRPRRVYEQVLPRAAMENEAEVGPGPLLFH